MEAAASLTATGIRFANPKWHNGEEGEGFYHYDGSDRDDKYSGGLIAGYDSEPVLDQLPAEERLNFE